MQQKKGRTVTDWSQDSARTRATWLLLAFAMIGLGVLLVMNIAQPTPIEGIQLLGHQMRGHDNETIIPTGERPPAGGVHHDAWQNCGVYVEPIGPENAVHSLEHGAVWITYRPDLATKDVLYLRELVKDQAYLLLSPYPGQVSPITLTAWGVQLELDSAEDNRLPAFIARYRLGPTTPERGAPCSGGVGSPLE